jgi:hypothetical protein
LPFLHSFVRPFFTSFISFTLFSHLLCGGVLFVPTLSYTNFKHPCLANPTTWHKTWSGILTCAKLAVSNLISIDPHFSGLSNIPTLTLEWLFSNPRSISCTREPNSTCDNRLDSCHIYNRFVQDHLFS